MAKIDELKAIKEFLEDGNAPTELITRIDSEISIYKKKQDNKSMSKTQKENLEVVRPAILNYLSSNSGKVFTTKQIADALGYSTQKVSPQLKKLVSENLIMVEYDKKTPKYSVI